MASLIYENYTGVLPDVEITLLAEVLGVFLGTQRLSPQFGEPQPRPPFPPSLVRTFLGQALEEHQGNVQIEAEVLRLLAEYRNLPAGDYVEIEKTTPEGVTKVKMNVRRRKNEIASALRQVYPVPDTTMPTDRYILGR